MTLEFSIWNAVQDSKEVRFLQFLNISNKVWAYIFHLKWQQMSITKFVKRKYPFRDVFAVKPFIKQKNIGLIHFQIVIFNAAEDFSNIIAIAKYNQAHVWSYISSISPEKEFYTNIRLIKNKTHLRNFNGRTDKDNFIEHRSICAWLLIKYYKNKYN